MSNSTDQGEIDATAYRQRKYRDAAALLPILGLFLLATPVFSAFTSVEDGSVLPRAIVYIFGVWAVLILLALVLARRLRPDNGPE